MITDPRFAPRRTDLPWLRRRHRPRPGEASAGPPAAGSAPLADFLAGRTTGRRPKPAAPAAPGPAAPAVPPAPGPPATPPARTRPAPSSSLDLDEAAPARPAPSSSLDLDEPAGGPAAPAPPAAGSTSLDLDAPPTPPAAAPGAGVTPAGPASGAATPTPGAAGRRVRTDVRVRPGERLILTPSQPTVTLNPLQSGIGTLSIEAAVGEAVGDLRLGAAYELASGLQMTMQLCQGNRFAPPRSRRPILVGSRERFEHIGVDLRQTPQLRRLVVYAFSESRRPLSWGGTLVLTTLRGARIELPLESLQGGDVAVLLSIYQIRGEFVVRAEMQALYGDVREAARAYGYDRITWLDGRSPVE